MNTPRQNLAATVHRTIVDMMVRRAISDQPKEGTVSIVDNGTVERWGTVRAAAIFKGGEWVNTKGRALSFVPGAWFDFRDRGDTDGPASL